MGSGNDGNVLIVSSETLTYRKTPIQIKTNPSRAVPQLCISLLLVLVSVKVLKDCYFWNQECTDFRTARTTRRTRT